MGTFHEQSCTEGFPEFQLLCYPRNSGKAHKVASGNLKEKELGCSEHQPELSKIAGTAAWVPLSRSQFYSHAYEIR